MRCALLGAYGLAVQLLLAASVGGFLLLKWRLFERDRRFADFGLDVSKQAVAAAFVHVLNLAQAMFFAGHASVGELSQPPGSCTRCNQCVWYLLSVVTDCLLSTLLCAVLLDRWLRPLLMRRYGIDMGRYADFEGAASHPRGPRASEAARPLVEEGEDGATERAEAARASACRNWLLQTGIWCLTVLVVRVSLVLFIFVLFKDECYSVLEHTLFENAWLDQLIDARNPKTQMLIALVVAPLVGNVFQFTLLDHVLKRR